MPLKTYDFKGVSEEDFEEAFKGDFEVIFSCEEAALEVLLWVSVSKQIWLIVMQM